MAVAFLQGAVAMGGVTAGMIFFRFWRQSRARSRSCRRGPYVRSSSSATQRARDDQGERSSQETQKRAHLGLRQCAALRERRRRKEERHGKANRGGKAHQEEVAELKP